MPTSRPDLAPGLILMHEDAAPPALFAEWCERRGIPYVVKRVWEDGTPPDPTGFPWICSLGSEYTPGKAGAPGWVDREVEFLRSALAADVPILGLCFGGQALAAAAGATVAPAEPAEVGWFEIESDAPAEIPTGPWLYFHYDQFELPDGATELARSPAGTAAFRLGSSLGLQFHPESTPAIADRWVAGESDAVEAIGVSPEDVTEAGARSGRAAATAAEKLFDRWWDGLGIG